MIRCYYTAVLIPPYSFFLLSKGHNAGKPGLKPWTNSFIVVCPHQRYFEFYFWLLYGLHKSGRFSALLRGSVIPFINREDVRQILREVAPAIEPDWNRYKEILESIENLKILKSTLEQQIVATEELQLCLLQKYFLQIQ